MPPQENEGNPNASSHPPEGSTADSSTSPNWAALRIEAIFTFWAHTEWRFCQKRPARRRMKRYLLDNKIDSALWLTRVFTIVTSILYLLPFFSPMFTYNCYKRVLISSAATSALRLHQRLPRFQFSREFFGLLLTEDSCHYLLYSIMFVNSQTVTIILIPVVLFALLHTVSFTKKLLDILGSGGIFSMSLIRSARKAIEKVELHQQGLMRFIACTEIMLMPAVILMALSGQAGIVIPFVYYRFVGFRYASRRNPYCRLLFGELRRSVEQLAGHPRCPAFLRTFVFKFTAFIEKLAPPMAPPPPQTASS